ncbi:MAG: DUF6285 domain-containing protein [Acidimicrobiia bacterium]|nr:DUF6285 domain-containing protein [Acidimicrobiia bacterium]
MLKASTGVLQHQVRVAANLCRIVERELSLEPAADHREQALLADLAETDPERHDTLALTRVVDERLAASDDADFAARTHAAALEIVRAKLAAAKPGHDDYDFATEREQGHDR